MSYLFCLVLVSWDKIQYNEKLITPIEKNERKKYKNIWALKDIICTQEEIKGKE